MEQLALAGIEIIIEVVFTYFLVSKSTSKLKKILILYIEESKKAQGKEMEVLGLIDKKNDLFFKQIKIQLGELFESLIEIITKNLLDHERKRRTKTRTRGSCLL